MGDSVINTLDNSSSLKSISNNIKSQIHEKKMSNLFGMVNIEQKFTSDSSENPQTKQEILEELKSKISGTNDETELKKILRDLEKIQKNAFCKYIEDDKLESLFFKINDSFVKKAMILCTHRSALSEWFLGPDEYQKENQTKYFFGDQFEHSTNHKKELALYILNILNNDLVKVKRIVEGKKVVTIKYGNNTIGYKSGEKAKEIGRGSEHFVYLKPSHQDNIQSIVKKKSPDDSAIQIGDPECVGNGALLQEYKDVYNLFNSFNTKIKRVFFLGDAPYLKKIKNQVRFYSSYLHPNDYTNGAKFIEDGGKIALSNLVLFAKDLCDALSFHMDISVMDLKPENFFIHKRTQKITIIDLGLQIKSLRGTLRGTPTYLIGPERTRSALSGMVFIESYYKYFNKNKKNEQMFDKIQTLYSLFINLLELAGIESREDLFEKLKMNFDEVKDKILSLCSAEAQEDVRFFLEFTRWMSEEERTREGILEQAKLIKYKDNTSFHLHECYKRIVKLGSQQNLLKEDPNSGNYS